MGISDLRTSETLYRHPSSSQGKSVPLVTWEENLPFPEDFAKKHHKSGKEYQKMWVVCKVPSIRSKLSIFGPLLKSNYQRAAEPSALLCRHKDAQHPGDGAP